MYQQLLQEHIDRKKFYDELPQPPATAAQLQDLRDRARKELGADLPNEYYELLGKTNGLDSNGMGIYASETTPIVGYEDKNRLIEGMVDATLGWWSFEPHKQYLFFGESGMGLYTLDLKDGKYKQLDRASADVLEEFDTFGELIRRGLEENRPPA